MRTSTLLLSASAGALLTLGAAGGTALADPGTPTAAAEPGAVSVSVASAAPGQTVRVSGTCPTPSDGSQPEVQSVTSTAFTGPETFSKTDPTAFDGTATIAQDAAAGAHPVLLTCSNGTASTTVTVTGGGSPTPTPTPTPEPTPAPSGGAAGGNAAGGADTGTGPGAGSEDGTADGGAGGDVVVESQGGSGDVPWGWVTAGGIVVLGAGVGTTYALTRRSGRGPGTPSGPASA
ncbi:hypothetical protein [Geodermatophilus amargosae]|uniref:hypothetical protein n=1 Tax=Geodermatophilus amargosae TaxID=1296565 RepID=UPI0034DF0733